MNVVKEYVYNPTANPLVAQTPENPKKTPDDLQSSGVKATRRLQILWCLLSVPKDLLLIQKSPQISKWDFHASFQCVYILITIIYSSHHHHKLSYLLSASNCHLAKKIVMIKTIIIIKPGAMCETSQLNEFTVLNRTCPTMTYIKNILKT